MNARSKQDSATENAEAQTSKASDKSRPNRGSVGCSREERERRLMERALEASRGFSLHHRRNRYSAGLQGRTSAGSASLLRRVVR